MSRKSEPILRILFLEDNLADRELVASHLNSGGLDCRLAFVKTEREFRAALADGKWDLILSDFTLPAYDGIRALGEVRETQPDTPFVFVSGTIGEERAVAGMKAGATDYIFKEHLERLPHAVRRALAEAGERAERRSAERRFAAFASLGTQLSVARTAREAAEHIVSIADRLIGWDACAFDLVSRDDPMLQPVYHAGPVRGVRAELNPAPGKPSRIALKALQEGGQMTQLPADASAAEVPGRPTSILAVPIRNGARLIGLLSLKSYRRKGYEPAQLETLQAMADQCGGALDRIQAEESLRRAQERLGHLLAQSPAIIYALKIDGTTIVPAWITDNIEPLLGYSVTEACQPGWWRDRLHPADSRLAQAADLAGGQPNVREYRLRRKQGDYRWLRDEQRMLRQTDGKPVEIVGSWTDITERKQLEEQFRQAQKMEAIGQLAGGVAHDFNNLLTVIRGNTELLLMTEQDLQPDSKEFMQQVAAASERAANLTRQLLAFGRKQIMQAGPVRLDEILGSLVKMLHRIIGAHIQLSYSAQRELPFIRADAGMMEQVLLNLVVNARDAMPSGGKLTISVERARLDEQQARARPEAQAGEFVRLAVRDTGSGIVSEHLPHIFEPFFTTKEPGRGTGLGLATVYGIIKQHRGWIEVDSKPAEGTLFQVFLPAIPAPPGKIASASSEAPLRGGTETILLVEDNEEVRLLTRRILENMGYRVREAVSGKAALEVWEAHRDNIQLLITDMIMPDGVSARELAGRLRAQKPSLRLIFTSGQDLQGLGTDTDFFRRQHAWFLPKPYAFHALLLTVRECLDVPASA